MPEQLQMTILISLFVVGIVLESVSALISRYKLGRLIGLLAVIINLGFMALIIANCRQWFGLLVAFVALYRVISSLRLVKSRIAPERLHSNLERSVIFLQALNVLALLNMWLWLSVLDAQQQLMVYRGLGLVAAMVALVMCITTLKRLSRAVITANDSKSSNLPTVSVLIPARNETAELTECLENIVASDYLKLEILVLDDCSQDRTPEIIREFAQRGIRFVGGQPAPESWLAKNYAYHQLASEATGEILLFMGVDLRLSTSSISTLVNEFLASDLAMMSILPKRRGQSMFGALVQPMRYFWELATPRPFAQHPPVLSTCWLITRKAYDKLGGLQAVSHTVIAENYFAKNIDAQRHYRFVRPVATSGITTIKSVKEQIATAIRTRYPQVKRRPENAMLLSIFELSMLLPPFIIIPMSLIVKVDLIVLIFSVITVGFLVIAHGMITVLTNPKIWPLSAISFPIVTATEVILLNYSMYKYEFSVVDWKGRNICLPVMHITPHLPPLPKH